MIRTRQPSLIVRVDPSIVSPVEAWIPHLTGRGLVRASPVTTEATYTVKAGPYGQGINVSATSRRYANKFDGSTAAAWAVLAARDGSAAGTTQSVVRENGSLMPVQEHSGSTVRSAIWGSYFDAPNYGATSLFQNRTTVFAGRIDATSGQQWSNITGLVTTPLASISTAGNAFCLGGNESGAEIATAWTILGVVLWRNSIPSLVELRQRTVSPEAFWSLFAPSRRVWVRGWSAPENPPALTGGYLPAPKRTRQPQGAANLNLAFYRRPSLLLVPDGSDVYRRVTGVAETTLTSSGISAGIRSFGRALVCAGGTSQGLKYTLPASYTSRTAWSYALKFSLNAVGANQTLFGSNGMAQHRVNTSNGISFNTEGSATLASSTALTLEVNREYTLVVTGTPGGPVVAWVNGVEIIRYAGSIDLYLTPSYITLGRRAGTTEALNGALGEFAFWDSLTLPEVVARDLSSNIYQLFAPSRRRFFSYGSSSGNTPETITLTKGSLGFTSETVGTNAKENLPLTKTAFSWSAKTLGVSASAAITLTKAAFSWSAKTISTNAKTSMGLTKATFGWTAKTLTSTGSDIVVMTKASLGWAAKTISTNAVTVLGLTKATFGWTAKTLSSNAKEGIDMVKATFGWTGQNTTTNQDVFVPSTDTSRPSHLRRFLGRR
jgi:hypothetical protein